MNINSNVFIFNNFIHYTYRKRNKSSKTIESI